ncbi:Ketosteroid isomerase homolog [Spirosomataceae bacterium TFI 002]|nr:Ketosteroid isomerase homolog [Spirosomataceae bacterium TFI 002]
MKNTILGLTLIMVTALVISCTPKTEEAATSTFDLVTAKAEIEAANKEFMALVAAEDSVGLANSYTHDAKLMSGGAPSVIGKANIQSAIRGMFESGLTGIDLRLENVYGTEDLIAEEGELTLYAGDNVIGEEKYIVLWKKEDGKWKLFRDIFNSNMPFE